MSSTWSMDGNVSLTRLWSRHDFDATTRCSDVFALPTAVPSLDPAVAVLAVLLLLGVVAALGTAVVRHLSNPVRTYRPLYATVPFPVAFLS